MRPTTFAVALLSPRSLIAQSFDFAGVTLHVQSFWLADAGLGDTCSPGWHELASSRGLSITLQP
ncbi:MAG: hypothetical protein JNM25_08245 [Planctomycetes bacterium]|nr:hypothetical protein [Planctomycetota bacterium]